MLLASKRFRTILASKRRFTRMASHMIFQMFFSRKRFRARGTNMWLIGRMTFHVPFQRRCIGKHVKTNIARKHGVINVNFTMLG